MESIIAKPAKQGSAAIGDNTPMTALSPNLLDAAKVCAPRSIVKKLSKFNRFRHDLIFAKVLFPGEMGSVRSEFQEAIGLNVEAEVIECRASDRAFSTLKLPFMSMYSNVILNKGVLANDNNIFDWFSQLGSKRVSSSLIHASPESAHAIGCLPGPL